MTINDLKNERFKDAPWFTNQDIECLVGGAGGIGSWLVFMLVRANMKITVFDFDRIETHNLGGQLYDENSIRKSKVDALYEIVLNFSNYEINPQDERYDETSITNPYAFSAFDNMSARRIMFTKWKNTYCNPELPTYDVNAIFIDGRLNAETFQIFCIKNNEEDLRIYEENLFDDSEVEDAPCTFKQTSHIAAMIASHMTAFFTNHMSNVIGNNNLRKVPRYYEYISPINFVNKQLIA